MNIRHFLTVTLVACQWLGLAHAEVVGAGATFPARVYDKWAQTYFQERGVQVGYQQTGSGNGVQQIKARTVDFGGTDSPLSSSELAQNKLIQIPMLVGGIVPVVNLAGITNNKLLLSGDVLADIMAGRITVWNDARITAQNSGLTLPARQIVRLVRAEKSGTTDGFTTYLSHMSASFKAEIGHSQLPTWPGQVLKAEGNDGITRTLRATEGAITYVSFDRVMKDALAGVRLKNSVNGAIAASEAGFRAAIMDSDVARLGNDEASLINRSSPQAWPITLTSFILIDQRPSDAARATAAMRYLYWCFVHGDELTLGSGFAPLPISLQARLVSRFAKVALKDGTFLKVANF
jgi:phosphate transport system substrate-binding protein